MKLKDLLPAKYNPRKDLKSGDPEYERLKKAIQEFDYIDPIIWNERSGLIVGGHQRAKILKDLGYTEVEVSVVNLDEDKEKALNLALNKTGGDWDYAKLKDLLVEIDTGAFDMEITGFGLDEIDKLLTSEPNEIIEDDFDADAEAEKIEEPITKPGDIWQLGKHRLMCGDSTMIDDVDKLMGGAKANMVFTDPPYNVDYQGKTSEALTIKNDKMGNSAFYEFLYDTFSCMYTVTEKGGAIYVCHADSEGINFRTAMVNAGWTMKQCLIWAKNVMVMGRQDYHWKHEPILYGWKPGASHKWYSDRKQTTVIEDKNVTITKKSEEETHITVSVGNESVVIKVPHYEVIHRGLDESSTIWRIDRPSRNAEHPTMKPIGIPARGIKNSSKSGDKVLDLFGGSGSTLMACEQTNRVNYTMELDPKYCDVIIKRWETFTGQKAVRVCQEEDQSL
jgi:DNA modification methylase